MRRLLEYLKSGMIEVRRYEKAFLHGKAYGYGGVDGLGLTVWKPWTPVPV